MNKAEDLTQKGIDLLITHGPRVLMAIVVLIVGLWLIRLAMRGMTQLMQKQDMDPSLIPFLRSTASVVLKVMLVISVVQMVGVETTSFVAVLASAALAVGLALSGTLQNFAGGVMILLFKPFKVGDFIEAQGHSGTVKSIRIFNTILATPDNRTVILPNAPVSSDALVNFSTEPQRRVDQVFGIGYNDDIDSARTAIQGVIDGDERIRKEPAPLIVVSELADSSVNFTVRVWVNTSDYWPVNFHLTETVKKEFDKAGISIPFPQMDVHTHAA